jgi:hypothetical protein
MDNESLDFPPIATALLPDAGLAFVQQAGRNGAVCLLAAKPG